MALASAPSTPDRVMPTFIRRSFTAPIKPSRFTVSAPEARGDRAETLYAHNTARIVSFNTSTSFGRRHSSVSNGKADFEESLGDLPWASATERTVAAGPLQIYRVLGSVAFLSSGSILQPVLAKSQCWCVDGESKIVLRIRANNFYRIELPFKSVEDKTKVEEFKSVLAKILQYEATPCPFKRGFTVELPEPPSTPIQKRPWKPKAKYEHMPEKTHKEPEVFETLAPVSRQSTPPSEPGSELGLRTSSIGTTDTSPITSWDPICAGKPNDNYDCESTADSDSSDHYVFQDIHEEETDFRTPTRPKILRTSRATTAPPQLTLRTLSNSDEDVDMTGVAQPSQNSPGLSSSMDSFHSFHSPISPLAPSPEFPDKESPPTLFQTGITMPRNRRHKRDVSETTVTGDSTELWDMTSVRSGSGTTFHSVPDDPCTPTLISDATSQDEDGSAEAITPSPTKAIRRRLVKSRHRTQSPLPPPANLYSPYSPGSHMSGHHLTTAILQRTCSLLLGPPAQLVALMLRIAAKLAKGRFRGSSFGYGEGGQKIPCSWDFSDGSDYDEEYEEDDFGFVLNKVSSSKNGPVREMGGSWEID